MYVTNDTKPQLLLFFDCVRSISFCRLLYRAAMLHLQLLRHAASTPAPPGSVPPLPPLQVPLQRRPAPISRATRSNRVSRTSRPSSVAVSRAVACWALLGVLGIVSAAGPRVYIRLVGWLAGLCIHLPGRTPRTGVPARGPWGPAGTPPCPPACGSPAPAAAAVGACSRPPG